MVTFQWATGQNFCNYLTDCPRAERCVPDIERMIALLVRSRAQNINLIAFSCSSPLLAEALVRLRTRHPTEGRAELARRYRLSNVIFAASDIDLKAFALSYVPPIMDLAEQTLVYMSRNDAALGFFSLISSTSRIGRPAIEELTIKDIERLAANPRLQAIGVSEVRGALEWGA